MLACCRNHPVLKCEHLKCAILAEQAAEATLLAGAAARSGATIECKHLRRAILAEEAAEATLLAGVAAAAGAAIEWSAIRAESTLAVACIHQQNITVLVERDTRRCEAGAAHFPTSHDSETVKDQCRPSLSSGTASASIEFSSEQ